jgi:hypothetical protein
VLFEENPIILIGVVIVVVEVWLRLREPLFHLIARVLGKGGSS